MDGAFFLPFAEAQCSLQPTTFGEALFRSGAYVHLDRVQVLPFEHLR